MTLTAECCAGCGQAFQVTGPLGLNLTMSIDAGTKQYHPSCFKCYRCHKKLMNDEYVSDEGKPHCIPCAGPTPRCQGCHISIVESPVRAFNHRWHQTCLKCVKCHQFITNRMDDQGFYDDDTGELFHLRCQ